MGSYSFFLVFFVENVGQFEEVSLEEQQEEVGVGEEWFEEVEVEVVVYLDELLELLLLCVLVELFVVEFVQVCCLVCLCWKELVDGVLFWLFKCQQEGLVFEGGVEDEWDYWQQFYFLSKRWCNLLCNLCGEGEGLCFIILVWGVWFFYLLNGL